MGKSEYNECRTLPGESEQPQIILDAEAIYGLLIRAEVMMSKVDRVRYANRAIEQILDVIREFILAYDFEDDTETPDMLKHELMERMARLDEGVTRWKKSIIKKRRVRGTTGIEG